ncbi:MAG TPA: hypothetical protein VHB21_03265 [Minicystis sp.]|nr:hypothetical protein [Minicystis sp.]
MRSSLVAVAAALLAGCGGRVVVDGAAGGAPVTSCGDACAVVVAACGGETAAACTAACQAQKDADVGTPCAALDDELTSCIVSASDPVVCGPEGLDVPASCKSLLSGYGSCSASP